MPFFLVIAAAAGAAHYRRRREEGGRCNDGPGRGGGDDDDDPGTRDDDDDGTPSEIDHGEDGDESTTTTSATFDGRDGENGADRAKLGEIGEESDEQLTNAIATTTTTTASLRNEACNDGNGSRRGDQVEELTDSRKDRHTEEDSAECAVGSVELDSSDPWQVDRMAGNDERRRLHIESNNLHRGELRRKVRNFAIHAASLYFKGGRDDQQDSDDSNLEHPSVGDDISVIIAEKCVLEPDNPSMEGDFTCDGRVESEREERTSIVAAISESGIEERTCPTKVVDGHGGENMERKSGGNYDNGDGDGGDYDSISGKVFDEDESKTPEQQRDQPGTDHAVVSAAVNRYQKQRDKRKSIDKDTPMKLETPNSMCHSEKDGGVEAEGAANANDDVEMEEQTKSAKLPTDAKDSFKPSKSSTKPSEAISTNSLETSCISPEITTGRETKSAECITKIINQTDNDANAALQMQQNGPIRFVVSAAVGAATKFQRRREKEKRKLDIESLTEGEWSNSTDSGNGNATLGDESSAVAANANAESGGQVNCYDDESLTAGNKRGMKSKLELVTTHDDKLASGIRLEDGALDGDDIEDAGELVRLDEQGPIRFVVSAAVGAANHFKRRCMEEAKGAKSSVDTWCVQGEASSNVTDGQVDCRDFATVLEPSAVQTSKLVNNINPENDHTHSTNEGPIDRVFTAAIEVANHFKRRLEVEWDTSVNNNHTVHDNAISTPASEQSIIDTDSTRIVDTENQLDESGTNKHIEMKRDPDELQVVINETDRTNDTREIHMRENSFISKIRHHSQLQRVLAQLELSAVDNPILDLDDAEVKKHHHLRDRVTKSPNTYYTTENKQNISFNYVVYHEIPTAEYIDDGTLSHFLMRTRRRRRIFFDA